MLLASAPASGASIYLGARGPSMAVIDAAVSAVAAASLAADWIDADEADAVLMGAVSSLDAISEAALRPVCLGSDSWEGPQTDGASAILIEARASAEARGAPILAELGGRWTGTEPLMDRIPGPRDAS